MGFNSGFKGLIFPSVCHYCPIFMLLFRLLLLFLIVIITLLFLLFFVCLFSILFFNFSRLFPFFHSTCFIFLLRCASLSSFDFPSRPVTRSIHCTFQHYILHVAAIWTISQQSCLSCFCVDFIFRNTCRRRTERRETCPFYAHLAPNRIISFVAYFCTALSSNFRAINMKNKTAGVWSWPVSSFPWRSTCGNLTSRSYTLSWLDCSGQRLFHFQLYAFRSALREYL